MARGYIPQARMIDGWPYWLCEYTRMRWRFSPAEAESLRSWLNWRGIV